MITADALLDGARYRDIEVEAVTPTTLAALVDGERVEVDLGATPALARDVQAVYTPGVERLRIAQADLRSVRASELDPSLTEAWLVVADPVVEAPSLRSFGAFTTALAKPTGYAAGLTADEIAMWPNLCAIIDEAVHDGGQSSSRNGASVGAFQVHHSTMTSAAAYIRLVQQLLRQVSSNLAIDVDGRIIRVVNLLRRAWTSGSATFDAAAITVETANLTLAPDYRLSEPAKASLGRVAAAIKADRQLQALTSNSVYLHREMQPRGWGSYATACPMDITAADIINRANRAPIGGLTMSDINAILKELRAIREKTDQTFHAIDKIQLSALTRLDNARWKDENVDEPAVLARLDTILEKLDGLEARVGKLEA